jgi:hypothetical protein
MKLTEIVGDYRVIEHSSKKRMFVGSRDECVSFIKGFDRGSKTYTDLRIFQGEREFDWHKNKFIGST